MWIYLLKLCICVHPYARDAMKYFAIYFVTNMIINSINMYKSND